MGKESEQQSIMPVLNDFRDTNCVMAKDFIAFGGGVQVHWCITPLLGGSLICKVMNEWFSLRNWPTGRYP
jgi:hypothetical protein